MAALTGGRRSLAILGIAATAIVLQVGAVLVLHDRIADEDPNRGRLVPGPVTVPSLTTPAPAARREAPLEPTPTTARPNPAVARARPLALRTFPSRTCRFRAPRAWSVVARDRNRVGVAWHSEARAAGSRLTRVECDVWQRRRQPGELARRAHATRGSIPGYREYAFGRERVAGRAAWVWQYAREEAGRRIRVTAVFYPPGAEVVTRAPEEAFTSLAPTFGAIASSYRGVRRR
jgi:hypothetical protein